MWGLRQALDYVPDFSNVWGGRQALDYVPDFSNVWGGRQALDYVPDFSNVWGVRQALDKVHIQDVSLVAGQAVWVPGEDDGIVFIGWDNSPRKLGFIYCLCRK